MSILLDFLRASTLADLPPVARQYFDDDEHFIDSFGGLDDVSKTEMIAGGLTACLKYNIKTDHEVARMMALSMLSQEDDYDEKKGEDKEQEVVVPMYEPEPEPEPEKPKHQPKPQPDPNMPKRGRGRPPKNPDASRFRCKMCGVGCASSGSLHNHYHSKPHMNLVLSLIQRACTVVNENEDKHYKVIVDVRDKKENRELGLSQENPDDGTFVDLEMHATDPTNPIIFFELCERVERKYESTGRPYFSWRKVSVSN